MATDNSASSGSCLILSADFLFGSRLGEAIKDRGYQVVTRAAIDHSATSDAQQTWQLILFDLTLKAITIEDVLSWQQTLVPTPRLLAFGPHVQAGPLEQAKQAGCELVLTRGQLDQQLDEVLDELLGT